MSVTGNAQIIGKRTITNASGGSAEITVHAPEVDEHGSYYCEYSLKGLGRTGRVQRAYGIDGLQALYSALRSVGSDLNELRQAEGYDLNWIGETFPGDLGLPSMAGDSPHSAEAG